MVKIAAPEITFFRMVDAEGLMAAALVVETQRKDNANSLRKLRRRKFVMLFCDALTVMK